MPKPKSGLTSAATRQTRLSAPGTVSQKSPRNNLTADQRASLTNAMTNLAMTRTMVRLTFKDFLTKSRPSDLTFAMPPFPVHSLLSLMTTEVPNQQGTFLRALQTKDPKRMKRVIAQSNSQTTITGASRINSSHSMTSLKRPTCEHKLKLAQIREGLPPLFCVPSTRKTLIRSYIKRNARFRP